MSSLYERLKEVSKADLCKLIRCISNKSNLNNETFTIVVYIISNDLEILKNVFSAKELKTCVLASAIHNSSYAGYEYNEYELLTESDDNYEEDFEESDTGLAWVCYDATWEFLCKLDNHIVTEPTIKFPI